MSDHVRLEVDAPLARITLRRPPLNVLTISMLDELGEAFGRVAATADVRVVLLEAEGKAFSAGVDVGDHVGDKVRPMMEALARLMTRMDAVPQPTLAVVQGAALGGGCELVLATDLAIAAEEATFGQPEIRLGLFAPPASVLLPRLVGERRALDLLLAGGTIPAAEAERIGLVNAVVPRARLAEEAGRRVDALLRHSGAALRLAKRAVTLAREASLADAHRAVDRLYLDELMQTSDAHEGLQAFLDKRPARWSHR